MNLPRVVSWVTLRLVATSICLAVPMSVPAFVSTKSSFGHDGAGGLAYTIPVEVPPGTAGMTPALALSYSSSVGNGQMGVGWGIQGLQVIERCPSNLYTSNVVVGVRLDWMDRFCLNGKRLVSITPGSLYGLDGTEYRTEVESFTKVISHGSFGAGPAWFEVWMRDGTILEFGNTEDSKIGAPGTNVVRLWALNKLRDRWGNYYTVSYNRYATGEYTPLRIDYTGNANVPLAPYNSVQFTFETRPDPSSYYVGSSKINQDYRLANVKTYAEGVLVKDFRITYDTSSATGKSRVTSITECAGDGVTCLGPSNFTYSAGGGGMLLGGGAGLVDLGTGLFPYAPSWFQKGDFNGDGVQDVLIGGSGLLKICYGPAFTQCTQQFGDGNSKVLVGDFNGDGVSDLAQLFSWGQLQVCYGPNFPGSSCETKASAYFVNRDFIVGDFDGDGRDDLYMWPIGTGDAFWCSVSEAMTWGNCHSGYPGPNGTNYKVSRGDFDGDGTTDLMFVGVSSYVICTWIGWNGGCTTTPVTWDNYRDNASAVVGDFNGDGKADLMLLSTQGLLFCPGPGVITSNQGCSWAVYGADWFHAYQPLAGDFNADGNTDLLLGSPAGTLICKGPAITSSNSCSQVNSLQWSGTNMIAADFTGDGSDDVMVFGYDARFKLGKGADGNGGATALPDFMASAYKSPAGTMNYFEFKPITDANVYIPGTGAVYPLQDLRGPKYVLSKLVYFNAAGGYNDKLFGYKRGLNQFTRRDFLGYEMVWEVDGGTGLRVETTRKQEYPSVGRVTDIKTFVNSTLQLVKHQVRTVDSITSFENRLVSALLSDRISNAGLNGEWQSDYMAYSYDSYGNVTILSYAKDENSYPNAFKKQEILGFQNDASQWLFAVPTTRSVYLNNEEGLQTSQNSSFTTYPGTRSLQTETVEPNNPAYTVTTTYTRNVLGNVFTTSVSAAGVETRTTSVGRDSRDRFVTSATNPMGHTTYTAYDSKFGGLLSSIDPNNLTTAWQYDGFGRKTVESRPDGTQTTWTYEGWTSGCCYNYALSPNQTHRIREDSTGKPSIYTSYDEMERVVLVKKQNFAGTGWVYTKNLWYDAKGKITRSYLPYEDSQAVKPYESMLYDALGRLETKFAGDGRATSYIYSGTAVGPITTTVRNSRTYDTKYVRNARGQLKQLIDANNKTTSYEYAPTGQLSKVTDPLGNQATYAYDSYGRMTSRTDPDLGVWFYANDRLGQLIRIDDAKSQTILFSYDKLGRKTTRGEPATVATWTWDTATKGVGKLASSTAVWPGGNLVRSFTFDALGRPSSESLTYPSGINLVMNTTYDASGRPSVLTYPTGFAVKNIYNTAGYFAEIRNNATNQLFWRATGQSAAGVTDEDYGNGTGVTRVYDQNTQRISQIAITRDSDSASLQGFNYNYDPVGNVEGRTETSQNVPETFAYDALDRLTIANHLTLGSAYKSYGYDDLSNLTSKSDVGAYTYPSTGKVHAVSSVPGTNYTYDLNGNLSSTGFANFTWTAGNFPNVITAGAWTYTWQYDADNNRAKYVSPSETRLYFGQGSLLMYQRIYGTTTDERHLIVANGVAVAQYTTRSSGASDTRYFYRDALGSITLIANEAGTVTERFSYDAHGKRRFPNGADDSGNTLNATATDLGYTGHEQLEEIGLIHMNGRLYDPRIGRFISADPIGESSKVPGGLNRYSYVFNNPFKFVDPTGYTSCSGIVRCWVQWIMGGSPGDDQEANQGNQGNQGNAGANSEGARPDYRETVPVTERRPRLGSGFAFGANLGSQGTNQNNEPNSPQPSSCDAASAFGRHADSNLPDSHIHEHGAVIYRDAFGNHRYTNPVTQGLSNRVRISGALPPEVDVVGDVHNHPSTFRNSPGAYQPSQTVDIPGATDGANQFGNGFTVHIVLPDGTVVWVRDEQGSIRQGRCVP
jgi:RHS repeat-associated protein